VKSLRVIAVVAALGACGKGSSSSDQGTEIQPAAFAGAQMNLPPGWTATYDDKADTWNVVLPGGTKTVRLERADERHVASPDAYMQHVTPSFGKGKLVTIEQRETVSNGFAITLAAYAGDKDPAPMRTTYVVKKLGRIWYTCHVDGVEDDTLRREVISMCRSVRL
jgi:hypothetical protein